MADFEYSNIVKAEFVSRPNRFIANVLVDGNLTAVHVKNTGRCRELLVKGATVYLFKSDSEKRKTTYDLVAVEKTTKNGILLINMDSSAVNDVLENWLPRSGLFSHAAVFKREVTYRSSRFDFFVTDGEKRIFIEAKGVTLERDGTVSFPDAPTERGVKHLCELEEAVKDGYGAFVIFLVQMEKADRFIPNDLTHKEFGDTLRRVSQNGVVPLAMTSVVTPDSITVDQSIPILL